MRSRILSEAGISLGVVVWLVAATILPFQLGLAGSGWLAFAGYVPVAGLLFAVADAVLESSFLYRPHDVAGMSVMKGLGLAFPAAVMFALGTWLAPTADGLDEGVCRLGGYAAAQSPHGVPGLDMDPNADCLPAPSQR